MDEKWLDPELVKLQRKHVETLTKWHDVAPRQRPNLDDMSSEQQKAMSDAMAAEKAYDDRRRELGLLQ